MKTIQEAICRRPTQLEANSFASPYQPAVEFAGWATSREAAALGQVAYVDQAEATVALEDKGKTIDLYAVWTKREVLTSWSDFSVSAQDCMSSDTVAMLAWTATQKLYYEGDSEPYLTSVVSSSGYDCSSEAFGANGVEGSEVSTAARQVVAKLTLEPYGTASCLANQGGYQPTYSLKILDPLPNCAQLSTCYYPPEAVDYEQQRTLGTTRVSAFIGSSCVYIGKQKRVGLLVRPQVWVAGTGCAHEQKPAKWSKHEGRSGCGAYLWQLSGWQASDGSFFPKETSSNRVEVDLKAGSQLSFAPVYSVVSSTWLSTFASDAQARYYACDNLSRQSSSVKVGSGSDCYYLCPIDGVYAISGIFGTDVQRQKICPPNWKTNVGGHLGAAGGFRAVCNDPKLKHTWTAAVFADKWADDAGHTSCYCEVSANRGDKIWMEYPYTSRLSNCTHVTCRSLVDVFPLRAGTSAAVSAVDSDALVEVFGEEEANSRGAAQKIELNLPEAKRIATFPSIATSFSQTYTGSGLICRSATVSTSFTVPAGGAYCKIDVDGGDVADGRSTYSSAIKSIGISYKLGTSKGQLDVYKFSRTEDFPQTWTRWLDIPASMARGVCTIAVAWDKAHNQRNTTSGKWSTVESVNVTCVGKAKADSASTCA